MCPYPIHDSDRRYGVGVIYPGWVGGHHRAIPKITRLSPMSSPHSTLQVGIVGVGIPAGTQAPGLSRHVHSEFHAPRSQRGQHLHV